MSTKRTRKFGFSAFVRGISAFFRAAGRGIARCGHTVCHGLSVFGAFVWRILKRVGCAVGHCIRSGFTALKKGLYALRRVIAFCLFLGLLGATLAFTVSGGVRDVTGAYVFTVDDVQAYVSESEPFDCILILGAGLRDDGSPSHMLYDRVLTGAQVWLSAPERFGTVLMSGDHTGDYNEPAAMEKTAVECGISEAVIVLDGEGYSTYESMERAKNVYGAKRILIVTQEYHLYRALYIARSLGLEAYGVIADKRAYQMQTYRELREVLAQYKDFILTSSKQGSAG